MKFIPGDVVEKLEFDKILELLSAYCISDLSKKYWKDPVLFTSRDAIVSSLSEVRELVDLATSGRGLRIPPFEDISQDVYLLSKDGYVLDFEGILRINSTIICTEEVLDYLRTNIRSEHTSLKPHLQSVTIDRTLRGLISKVLDEEGNVRPNASPELARIIRSISQKGREADKEFNRIIGQLKGSKVLTESEESYKNGRRVLSVPSEHKKKISGIIQDESATGKTSYIEPQTVVVLNNQIIELDVERRQEIYRIIKQLCKDLQPYREDLQQFQEFLITMDIIKSKARLAKSMNGQQPNIQDHPCIRLKSAYHPLLLLKNSEEEKDTVPFTMELDQPNRLLLISGPNAGGKSITLKAVGLIQLMIQAGCLVPVDANSTFGIFEKVFCDIGDQQSLDDDLSTYSSRLKNMRDFLQQAGSDTLIFIDEFGSGTDPKIGGAIAESILFTLNQMKCYGVITTHYSNLKMMAHKLKGLINGAMYFDEEQLKPTYEFKMGRPGSSFAYEIAEKVGLPKKILYHARKNTGKNTKQVDELLVDLQREKKEVEEKLSTIKAKEAGLQKLINNYTELHKQLEYQRKKHKLARKEFEVQEKRVERKELEKLLKDLRKQADVEKVQKIIKKKEGKRQLVETEMTELKQEVFYKKTYALEDFKVGDYVKMRTSDMAGQIKEISKGKDAILTVGNMQVTVPLNELEPTGQPLERNRQKRIQTELQNNLDKAPTNIDIRGYQKQEALMTVESFVDNALMANHSLLKIIHGKGSSGYLKRLVHSKLKEYNQIQDVFHPTDEQGGDGVTWIKL